MAQTFPPLMSLESIVASVDPLPDVRSGFLVPRLQDKPQNPIMDTLKFLPDSYDRGSINYPHPINSKKPMYDIQAVAQTLPLADDHLWEQLVSRRVSDSAHVMSWDTLYKGFKHGVSSSPFLSAQNSQVLGSVRYHVRPPLQEPGVQLLYITPSELLRSLRLSLSGLSSPLHIWDTVTETFVLRDTSKGSKSKIVLTGTDEVVSRSYVQRFLTIGTIMRRLETLVDSHWSSRMEPVVHSFIHALSSILEYLRGLAANQHTSPPSASGGIPADGTDLISCWMQYAALEEILYSLSVLCYREEHISPSDYTRLPTSPAELLTRVYQFLADHLESNAPRVVTAMFAYILTAASRVYFREICASVGYISDCDSRSYATDLHNANIARPNSGLPDEDRPDGQDDIVEDDTDAPLPSFMEEVAEALPRARRSLKLLHEAAPEHQLLNIQHRHPVIKWIWTLDEVKAAWNGVNVNSPGLQERPGHTQRNMDLPATEGKKYKEDLQQFAVFDLNPGATLLSSEASIGSDLRSFLDRFPASLPSLTPTLTHLVSLVLSPLVKHIHTLSEALLSPFLSTSSHLNLRLHLVLLRSYLLLTSDTFKSRLVAALFSDSDDHNAPALMNFAATEHHSNTNGETLVTSGKPSSVAWAVGLSSSLTQGATWPPKGTDLGFHLRTVIVDTLENSMDRLNGLEVQEQILQEAEYRLGFAIRDLPSNTGKERWLDPLSIEALDFLYMDYKPLKPLDVLINPAILSKYHRMFAFNLRLIRATTVTAAIFRMTRKAQLPLFPTLSQSNRLLLQFRFVAHSFVTSLSSYVYDKAIGGNFDAFLARLSSAEGNVSQGVHIRDGFSDIFSLADHHSHVMDDILSACLLRSGQKAAGDLLRGCLELVVEFGILAGERYRGRVEEYQAAGPLEDLWSRFRLKMLTLIKVLKALADRGANPSHAIVENMTTVSSQFAQVQGVTSNWQDLVIRLDVADWWVRTRQQPSTATHSQ